MRRILGLMEQQVASDVTEVETELDFHLVISRGCGNQVLADCLCLVASRMQKPFSQPVKSESLAVNGRSAAYLSQHQKVVAAIAEGHGVRAQEAMLEHLKTVEPELTG